MFVKHSNAGANIGGCGMVIVCPEARNSEKLIFQARRKALWYI